MNLPDTIYAHAKALPPDLQREALDFIAWLEQRYATRATTAAAVGTELFLQQVAGGLLQDFPDDISDIDLGTDAQREGLV